MKFLLNFIGRPGSWQKKAAYKAWSASFSSLSIWRRTPRGSVCKGWQRRPGWPSLVGLGYVVQDEENGHYRLTLKMFELSSGIVDSMDIMGVAKAHLERLSQRTGEAVHLVIRDGRDIVYIYKTESGPMRMSSRVGLRSPLYCTGVGKAILATLPGDELEDIWTHSNVQKLTDKTITDLEELRSQLVEVRANGYAIDDEENELGVRCVAVAIPGADGRAESAFSISGLAPYMTPERIRRIATLALDARTDILADLGLR